MFIVSTLSSSVFTHLDHTVPDCSTVALLLRIYFLNYAAVMSQLYGAVMPCGVLQTHKPTTHPWTINSILKVPG